MNKPLRPKQKDSDQELAFLPNFCTLDPIFKLTIGAQLLAFVLILAHGDKLSESWDELALLSIFVQWIALASAAVLCLFRPIFSRLTLFWSSCLAYGLVLVTAGGIALVCETFLITTQYQWGSSPDTIGEFVSRCLMISAIIALVALRYYYIQQQWKQKVQLESQAKVEALQARIRPHFLFNSMNIIASLIRSKPQLAELAVEDLSELFRATLKDRGSLVSIEEEIELCQHYIRIENLRLGDRLNMKWDIEDLPKDASIPMLSLQPLMENAIYHGIQPLPEGGTIEITGYREDNQLRLLVYNPVYKGYTRPEQKGNRLALANIRHRWNLLFGHKALVEIESKPNSFLVTLHFPYIKVTKRELVPGV